MIKINTALKMKSSLLRKVLSSSASFMSASLSKSSMNIWTSVFRIPCSFSFGSSYFHIKKDAFVNECVCQGAWQPRHRTSGRRGDSISLKIARPAKCGGPGAHNLVSGIWLYIGLCCGFILLYAPAFLSLLGKLWRRPRGLLVICSGRLRRPRQGLGSIKPRIN